METNQSNTFTFIEQNNKTEEDFGNLKPKLPRINPILAFLLNRRNQLMIFVWVFALTVPILCYFFLFHQQLPLSTSIETCSVNSTFRVNCGNLNLTDTKSRQDCLKLSCCFDDFTRECYHSLPSRYFYTSENKVNLDQSPFLTASDRNVYMFYEKGTDNVKIRLTNDKEDNFKDNQKEENVLYTIKENPNKLEVNVQRKNSDKLILTSTLGPLISTEHYFEITFYMGEHLFGLDQLYFNKNETYTKIIYHNGDDHTTIPAFIAFQDGKFHGFLIDYDGPIEISVLPSRLIVLRAIGKRSITFTLHVGPTPKDIAKFFYKQNDYQVPEKWILGPHICRSGSENVTYALEVYNEFYKNSTAYDLTYESDCFDENLYFMMLLNEPFENSFPTRFIMSLFPHIPNSTDLFDISLENNLLYEKNETEPQNGTYFGLDVFYPNYNHENINILIDALKKKIDKINPDGFSFSNNWASDDSLIKIETSKEFIYTHENITKSFSKTLLYNSTSKSMEHYYNHNSYGKDYLNSFNFPKTSTLTTSTFTKTSIVQVENMNGTWQNLKSSLTKTISHGLFAYPLISIPICGSTGHFDLQIQIELCTRWYMMGAFMPIVKISSVPPFRDPASFHTDHHRNRVLESFKIREKFFLYLYTILIKEEPIIRPMFYEFYNDLVTFGLDEQYMVGENLLLAQPFLPECSIMRIYFPENEVFYEYFGGMEYSGDNSGWINFTCRPTDWFIFIRGGSILVLSEEVLNEVTKKVSFQVVVALKNTTQTEPENNLNKESSEKEAFGSVIFDGVELNFSATETSVTISKVPEDFCVNKEDHATSVDSVIIYGLEEPRKEFNKIFDLCTECFENDCILPLI